MGRSKAQLEAELRMLKRSRVAEGVISVAQTAIKYGALVWICYYGYQAVAVLAGKHTLADIGLNFLANVKVSVALSWAVAVGGFVYGKNQNRLRKNSVERLQGRVKELELKIDPHRTSSSLTVRGETRPEDRL